MRIKEGFTMRTIVGQHVVIGEGLAQVDFNKMITMNDSAAYLWEGVAGKDFTVDDLTKLLTDHYEVEEERARADAEKIAAKWLEAGNNPSPSRDEGLPDMHEGTMAHLSLHLDERCCHGSPGSGPHGPFPGLRVDLQAPCGHRHRSL